MNGNKAFTIIELLVVMSIITLLLSLILIPMSAARFKAKDSRIGTAMAQIRPSAALYFATNDTYVGFENDPSVAILISDIIMQGGEKPSDGGGGVEIAEKVDAYCVEVKMNGPLYWCVDSTGVSKQYESNPACDTIADRYTCD